MSSPILKFLAAALVLFSFGQALADPAKVAAHQPQGLWGTELPFARR